jgi:type I restriction enzyme, S subunit
MGDGEDIPLIPSTMPELPPEWRWKRLEAVCAGVFDCPHSTPELGDSGPYLIRSQDMRFGVFKTDEAAHVSEATYAERIARAEPRHGDLLYSREGTYFGIAAQMPAGIRGCLGQRMVLLRPDPTVAESRYLLYWLNSRIMALHVLGLRDGSVAERLNLPTIRRLPIGLPPLAEQRAIAHILGTLDDKIELNRRMNETLEAMARALFESWFVDFEPVHAKAEGRKSGLIPPIENLFPDSLEDSEIGEIPRGWKVQRIGDLLTLDKGLSYKGQFLTDAGVPMINLGCFLGGGRFNKSAIKNYSGEFKARHTVQPRDLLIANTDITQQRKVLGSPALIPPLGQVQDLIFSHHVFAARFKNEMGPLKLFIYFTLLQENFRERAAGFATGTTVLALPRDAVLDLSVPMPPTPLAQAFESLAAPMIERVRNSEEECAVLSAQRDALLPKLISGELRVTNFGRLSEKLQ